MTEVSEDEDYLNLNKLSGHETVDNSKSDSEIDIVNDRSDSEINDISYNSMKSVEVQVMKAFVPNQNNLFLNDMSFLNVFDPMKLTNEVLKEVSEVPTLFGVNLHVDGAGELKMISEGKKI